ncbi:hypothetical protein ACFLQN_03640 [Candidatus Aenigmatarchaeota archaeon]
MKKTTQSKLMVLFVVLIFGMSTIAYVFMSATNFGSQESEQTELLEEYIIEGDIDPNIESQYVQNGYTFLKYYYNEGTYFNYLESLPTLFQTNTGQMQLFIVKIPDEREFISINNLNGIQEIEELSEMTIFAELCGNLLSVPAECILTNFTSS